MIDCEAEKNISKIGVISDTHIPVFCPSLPKELLKGLEGVDYIIHAGDFVSLSVLKKLEKIAPLYAVSGNMDSPEIKRTIPSKKEIKISHFKIGIIHGYGKAEDLHLRMRKEFEAVDIIIFGHSHHPLKQVVDGVLMFNPGSATDKIFTDTNTFGLIELNSQVKAEHIEI